MFERLLNKQQKPTENDLAVYCGGNCNNFTELNNFLCAEFNTVKELRFPYGKSYGWCVTHRKGKKLICDIFAEAEAFTVMIRLSNTQYSAVYKQLLKYTQEYVDNKYQCGDGGWIHYRVTSQGHLNDIKILLSAKLL